MSDQTIDLAAASAAGLTATLRVSGDGPVARAAARHLVAAGFAHVDVDTRGGPGVLARVGRRDPDGSWRPVAFALGGDRAVLVGPVDRDAAPGDERAALAALGCTGLLGADDDAAGRATGRLLEALAGAQLARSVQTSSVRQGAVGGFPGRPEAGIVASRSTAPGRTETEGGDEAAAGDRCPAFLVTTGDLETALRPLVDLGPLGPGGRRVPDAAWTSGPTAVGGAAGPDAADVAEVVAVAAAAAGDAVADVAALDRVAPVWDPVLGVVGEPLALDLPQLPVGLAAVVDADGRAYAGTGTTTAAARLDAVLAALRAVAGPPAAGHALGVGSSAPAARADAVARLVGGAGTGWRPVASEPAGTVLPTRTTGSALPGLEPTDDPARGRGDRSGEADWLHAVLVALGEPGVVEHARRPDGLVRTDVRSRTGTLLGRAVATSVEAATHEALARAAGRVRWATAGSGLVPAAPGPEVLGARTPEVRDQLDRWARRAQASGAVVLRVPRGADGWERAGLHAAVASWT